MTMTEKEWLTWLENIPNVEVEGFQERVYDWAEDHACDMCDDLIGTYCVQLIEGNVPREWIEEAYDTFTQMCLEEEDARKELVRIYEGADSNRTISGLSKTIELDGRD